MTSSAAATNDMISIRAEWPLRNACAAERPHHETRKTPKHKYNPTLLHSFKDNRIRMIVYLNAAGSVAIQKLMHENKLAKCILDNAHFGVAVR
jgi:hypothetical protein